MSIDLRETPGVEVPPLVHGERLDRDEFERRYHAMPPEVRAELLDGVVYIMASPVSFRHASPHLDLTTWIGNYTWLTPGVAAADNGTLRLTAVDEPQPDAMLFISEECGGLTRISADGYPEGSPEFLAEVAVSSVHYDVNVKLPIYRRAGVQEYLIWRVEDDAIDWYILRNGRYELLPPGEDGITRSVHLPGLWLDAAALARRDAARVLAVQTQGIAGPEHANFVAALAARRTGTPGGDPT